MVVFMFIVQRGTRDLYENYVSHLSEVRARDDLSRPVEYLRYWIFKI